ncbi:MAG: hypothetical protein AAF517_25405 [Planctomycetota bacterium]
MTVEPSEKERNRVTDDDREYADRRRDVEVGLAEADDQAAADQRHLLRNR